MPSNHTLDPDVFYSVIAMLDGSDVQSATQMRAALEKIADNTAFLKSRIDGTQSKQTAALRLTDATMTDTNAVMAASTPFGVENCVGPVLAAKAAQGVAVFDMNTTAAYPGGAIPNLTSVLAAAVNPAGRIVLVGATTPFCAFKIPGGSWTGGGAEIGGTPGGLIYSPAYGGFISWRVLNIYRSTDATAWTATDVTPSGLSGSLTSAAVVGAGTGAGIIIVQSNSTAPNVRRSLDNGVSFTTTGTIPNRLLADEGGNLAGCPLVTRSDLNQYVYHCFRASSGTALYTAKTSDGVTWTSGQTLTPPTGHTFTGAPSLKICQSSGFMAIVVPATRTSDASAVTLVYTSLDWSQWADPAVYPQAVTAAWAVAGGKLLLSASAALRASDGVAFGVH